MNSKTYWEKRETEALKNRIKDEVAYERAIKRIYNNQLDAVQKEINAFYGRYAASEGITLAEAKKRVSKLDIEAYERKAERYVAEKNFSKRANAEMRLYNATMKINRLEMLKANIGLELIAGHDELDEFMKEILQDRTEDELKRQAGILGETIKDNSKTANSIVDASFHNANFSDRIWMYQDLLKADLSKLLQQGIVQGKNPRVLAKEVQKKFGSTTKQAETLMRTELARVQTDAQKQSFVRNGFDKYTFIVNGGCCPICEGISGKHFLVSKMMPGENAPPMHPNCRCSTAAYVDGKEYEEWIEGLSRGENAATTKLKDALSRRKKNDEGVFSTFNNGVKDIIKPRNIQNNLRKSKTGNEALEYLNRNNVPVELFYGVDSRDMDGNRRYGYYDAFDDIIIIFADETKTVQKTAEIVIHEATHRRINFNGTQKAEAYCIAQEYKHRTQKEVLTAQELKNIIKKTKELYPNFKWRE